jgi:hypothetical protein
MAWEMQQLTPELWDLLGLMLSANQKQCIQQQAVKDASIDWGRTDQDRDHTMYIAEDDEDNVYWEGQDEFTVDDVDIVESGGTYQHTQNVSRNAEHCEALIMIVCPYFIFLQSTRI